MKSAVRRSAGSQAVPTTMRARGHHAYGVGQDPKKTRRRRCPRSLLSRPSIFRAPTSDIPSVRNASWSALHPSSQKLEPPCRDSPQRSPRVPVRVRDFVELRCRRWWSRAEPESGASADPHRRVPVADRVSAGPLDGGREMPPCPSSGHRLQLDASGALGWSTLAQGRRIHDLSGTPRPAFGSPRSTRPPCRPGWGTRLSRRRTSTCTTSAPPSHRRSGREPAKGAVRMDKEEPAQPCAFAPVGRGFRQRGEVGGIEPLTFSLRTRRATNCATAPGAKLLTPPRGGTEPAQALSAPSTVLAVSTRRISTAAISLGASVDSALGRRRRVQPPRRRRAAAQPDDGCSGPGTLGVIAIARSARTGTRPAPWPLEGGQVDHRSRRQPARRRAGQVRSFDRHERAGVAVRRRHGIPTERTDDQRWPPPRGDANVAAPLRTSAGRAGVRRRGRVLHRHLVPEVSPPVPSASRARHLGEQPGIPAKLRHRPLSRTGTARGAPRTPAARRQRPRMPRPTRRTRRHRSWPGHPVGEPQNSRGPWWPRLGVALGDPQGLRDLGHAAALVVGGGDHLAVVGGQAAERVRDQPAVSTLPCGQRPGRPASRPARPRGGRRRWPRSDTM